MTDGAEESCHDVEDNPDSQGSLGQILLDVLEEHERNGLPFAEEPEFFGFSNFTSPWQENSVDSGPLLENYVETQSLTHPSLAEDGPNEASDHISLKCELEYGSPDSGYSHVNSNASLRNDNNDGNSIALCELPSHGQPAISNPARSAFGGDYGFQVHFDEQDHVPKSASYTFSVMLGKLFVKMNSTCCFQFKCCKSQPPTGSVIRGMLLFQKDEHRHEPVCRCQTHLCKESDNANAKHVLQIAQTSNPCMQNAVYTSTGGRFSVAIPFDPPCSEGEAFIVGYTFTCLSTCIGGINRRPLLAVFTLENDQGYTLGRACMEVKICSCPGRDRPKEEERKKKRDAPAPLPRKRRLDDTPLQGYKFLRVREEHYDILSKINDALNLASLATDEQRSHCQEEERKISWAQQLAKFYRDDLA